MGTVKYIITVGRTIDMRPPSGGGSRLEEGVVGDEKVER